MKSKRAMWVAFGGLTALLLMAACLSGCHRQRGLGQLPRAVRVVVLDFDVPEIFHTTKEIRGWWFGAHDIYRNPYAGKEFADVFARRLGQSAFVDVYPRKDLEAYMVMQEDRIRRAYPQLSKEQVENLLGQIKPWEWGKDLEVDKVITGKLLACSTVHNRAIHWWYSTMEANIQFADVHSGSVEWEKTMRCTKQLASQQRTQECLADRVVRQLKKRHLLY
jgi:hypothetical protein